jgi:hypothetical protein
MDSKTGKFVSRNLSDMERFMQYIVKTDTCWLWKGAHDAEGYAQFSEKINGRYIRVRASRTAFRLFKGEDLHPEI